MIDELLKKSEADECINLIQLILNDCKKIKTTISRIQSSAEINPFPSNFQKSLVRTIYTCSSKYNNKQESTRN